MASFHKTKGLTDAVLHYCPGCTHGIVHRLVAESLEELGIWERPSGLRRLAVQLWHTTILTAI